MNNISKQVAALAVRQIGTRSVSRTVRLRLATGPGGDELFPTEAEAASAERAAREAVEAENARLRAEIERLRAKKRR